MNVIVCVDDGGGMLFHHRRQSRDTLLFEDIATYLTGEILIHPFSEKLFSTLSLPFRAEEDFLLKAKKGEYCFVEHVPLCPYLDRIETLTVYRWNRKYPSDFKLDIDPSANFRWISTVDFPGKAHKKITREIYKK